MTDQSTSTDVCCGNCPRSSDVFGTSSVDCTCAGNPRCPANDVLELAEAMAPARSSVVDLLMDDMPETFDALLLVQALAAELRTARAALARAHDASAGTEVPTDSGRGPEWTDGFERARADIRTALAAQPAPSYHG